MIDYTKPGKTAPGTKHPRPEPTEKMSWHKLVAPGPAPAASAKEEPVSPTVLVTRPVSPTIPERRRERRAAARSFGLVPKPLLVTDEVDRDSVIDTRRRKRAQAARLDRRQRKGSRAFNRQQFAAERQTDTVQAMVRVAQDPMLEGSDIQRNAIKGLEHRQKQLTR